MNESKNEGSDAGHEESEGEESEGESSDEERLVPWSKVVEYMDQVRKEEKKERERMAVKVGEHLDYMKDKLREEQGPPNFKNAYNIKHFERTQKYIGFLIDAKYYIECKSYDESHSCIAAALEALFLYKKQISIADKSPFNWETVDRLGGLTDEATVRKVEAQIAEEKKNKKKDENSQSSSGAPFGRQGGGGRQHVQRKGRTGRRAGPRAGTGAPARAARRSARGGRRPGSRAGEGAGCSGAGRRAGSCCN